MSLSGTELIEQYEMYFDGADMTNASLYLCVGDDFDDQRVQQIIDTMRGQGLWSADAAKVVPAEHKPMYAEQMKFIGYVSGALEDKVFHLAAYDHEKFPYQAERWQQWQDFVTASYPGA